jgi:hypothetical protein
MIVLEETTVVGMLVVVCTVLVADVDLMMLGAVIEDSSRVLTTGVTVASVHVVLVALRVLLLELIAVKDTWLEVMVGSEITDDELEGMVELDVATELDVITELDVLENWALDVDVTVGVAGVYEDVKVPTEVDEEEETTEEVVLCEETVDERTEKEVSGWEYSGTDGTTEEEVVTCEYTGTEATTEDMAVLLEVTLATLLFESVYTGTEETTLLLVLMLGVENGVAELVLGV